MLVQEPAPARLIEVGIPTEGTVAHVLVARQADDMPLYRQVQGWARQGVVVDRSTLASWVGMAAAELAPVVARLKQIVLASDRIFADETVVPVLERASLLLVACPARLLRSGQGKPRRSRPRR